MKSGKVVKTLTTITESAKCLKRITEIELQKELLKKKELPWKPKWIAWGNSSFSMYVYCIPIDHSYLRRSGMVNGEKATWDGT